MTDAPHRLLDLLLTTARMLLESGAETHRAESTARYKFHALAQGPAAVSATGTMITIDVVLDGRHYTGMQQVLRRGIHIDHIERINAVSRAICAGRLTIKAALEALAAIQAEKPRSKWVAALAAGFAASAFALILGGGWTAALLAALFAAASQLLGCLFRHAVMDYFLIRFTGGLLPALLVTLAARFCGLADSDVILIAAMFPLFPGVAMVNAIRDTMNGDLTSGVARAAEVLLSAAGLAIGTMIGVSLCTMW